MTFVLKKNKNKKKGDITYSKYFKWFLSLIWIEIYKYKQAKDKKKISFSNFFLYHYI